MEYIKISVADEFSKTPGPRNRDEGDFSGQEFLENILDKKFTEALSQGNKVVVDLDRTVGYGTSFLEEVFGGLARKHTPEKVMENLDIISTEEEYLKKDIEEYIKDSTK